MSSLADKLKSNLALERKALNLDYAFTYGVNFEHRTITIDENIDEGIFNWFDTAMTEMEHISSRKTITIKINTFGGYLYEANSVIGRISASPCHIVTEGHGKVMSAGVLILASGDKRRASRFCRGMHHAAAYDMDWEKTQAHEDFLKEIKEEG